MQLRITCTRPLQIAASTWVLCPQLLVRSPSAVFRWAPRPTWRSLNSAKSRKVGRSHHGLRRQVRL